MKLDMVRGASAQWNIPITLSGVADPLPPQAIVTWTATSSIGSAPTIEKTSAHGILIIDAQAGLAQLQFDPADTLVLPGDRDVTLPWAVWLDIDADRWCLARGSLLVHASARSFA